MSSDMSQCAGCTTLPKLYLMIKLLTRKRIIILITRMVVIYLSTRYLVRYRYGQAPGYAVPGSTRFAPREAPARLAPTWGMSTMDPAAPYACRGGYILAKNNLRGAQPCPCKCHTPRREWREYACVTNKEHAYIIST